MEYVVHTYIYILVECIMCDMRSVAVVSSALSSGDDAACVCVFCVCAYVLLFDNSCIERVVSASQISVLTSSCLFFFCCLCECIFRDRNDPEKHWREYMPTGAELASGCSTSRTHSSATTTTTTNETTQRQ